MVALSSQYTFFDEARELSTSDHVVGFLIDMFRDLPPSAAPIPPAELFQGMLAIQGGDSTRQKFESALQSYFGCQRAYTFNSGRAALWVMLEGMKSDPSLDGRRQVILPAYTCPVLVRIIQDVDLEPVFCDIDPQSFDFDLERLCQTANEGTLGIIHVHPFGLPRSKGEVEEVARRVGALVIEDACQAFGSFWDRCPVGSQSLLGFASFGPGKPLSLGGGGVLLVNDTRWVQRVEEILKTNQSLSHSTSTESITAWMRLLVLDRMFRPSFWWLVSRIGLNKMGDNERNWGYRVRRLTSTQAAVGQLGLARLGSMNAARREVAQTLHTKLVGSPGVSFIDIPPPADPVYLRFPVLVDPVERRESLYRRLRQAGIGVGKMYKQTLAEIFPEFSARSYPGAAYISRRLLTLPTHVFMQPMDLETIVNTFRMDLSQ